MKIQHLRLPKSRKSKGGRTAEKKIEIKIKDTNGSHFETPTSWRQFHGRVIIRQ